MTPTRAQGFQRSEVVLVLAVPTDHLFKWEICRVTSVKKSGPEGPGEDLTSGADSGQGIGRKPKPITASVNRVHPRLAIAPFDPIQKKRMAKNLTLVIQVLPASCAWPPFRVDFLLIILCQHVVRYEMLWVQRQRLVQNNAAPTWSFPPRRSRPPNSARDIRVVMLFLNRAAQYLGNFRKNRFSSALAALDFFSSSAGFHQFLRAGLFLQAIDEQTAKSVISSDPPRCTCAPILPRWRNNSGCNCVTSFQRMASMFSTSPLWTNSQFLIAERGGS